MKIIDIIKESAHLLDLPRVIELLQTDQEVEPLDPEIELTQDEQIERQLYFNNEAYLNNPQVFKLFNLAKFAIQELCTNYVPTIAEKVFTTTDKSFNMAGFENYIRMHNITKNGELVKYKIVGRTIQFEEDDTYLASYYTYPQINTLYDEIDFLSNFSIDVIVFGLCAYFSLAEGLFEEFTQFHEQYIERAENLKELKIFTLPARRFEWNKKRELK